jgi:hypothetical protein
MRLAAVRARLHHGLIAALICGGLIAFLLTLIGPAAASAAMWAGTGQPAVTSTWNGSVSTDWNVAANWTPAAVPQSTSNVVLAVTTNEPVLTSAVTVNSITIAAGASLYTNAHSLTTSTKLINNGTLALYASVVTGPLTNNGLLRDIDDTSSSISGAMTNAGTVVVQSSVTACCPNNPQIATLTTTSTLTNTSSGTINLTSGSGGGCCNGGASILAIGGTLTNSGTINALAGTTGGGRVLSANALNGTITAVSAPLYLNPNSGTEAAPFSWTSTG